MAGKFEIYTDKKGEFRFRLKASNGQTVLMGEGYKSKKSCDKGIASVQKNAAESARFERKHSSDGKHYFVLKAANHQVIGQSEMYGDAAAMENGIKSVMSNAASAGIDDQTIK